MCGIAGFVQRRSSPPARIEAMMQRLAHRGPDGHGVWTAAWGDWAVSLGHQRLSIIDLEHGGQPMANETGSVQITYNGEVYNFRSLRQGLERAGHRFATRSDTEVIVHQCEQAGPEGLSQLNGIFALGIWDQDAGTLLLARDRVGVKPLYYARLPDGGLAFASELTALLEHPAIPRQLDPAGLASYFFSDYAQPPRTLLRDAHKLEPGHYLLWRDGVVDGPRPYWRLDDLSARAEAGASLEALAAELRQRLDTAVESQMVADVPVGVFLSGGIDSSLVAALAQRHADRPLQTFSIGFDDPDYDESPFARRVASHIGSQHVERTLSESMIIETLEAALSALDEPIGDPSIVPTYLVSQVAAEHVKVALGGDGGDELWAGYPTYTAHRYARIYGRLPRLVRQGLIARAVAALPVREGYQSLEWKAKRFALRWDDDAALRHLRWMSGTDLPDLGRILPGFAELGPEWQAQRDAGLAFDAVNRILALDFRTYLPGNVLTKVDRMSMAHGLEVRPPMLDNTLVDFAFSLPSRFKLGGATKLLLKRAAEGILPAEIVHRKKKGFAIPLARWLRGPLRPRLQSLLAASPLWETGLLDQRAFVAWESEHQLRRIDRSKPLWALLVLDHWFRRIRPG